MKWTEKPEISVETSGYRAVLVSDRPLVRLNATDGRLLMELFLIGSAHTLTGRDVTLSNEQFSINPIPNGVQLNCTMTSSFWKSKQVALDFYEDHLTLHTKVEGDGYLTDVELLGGYYTGSVLRWSNARFYSKFYGEGVFMPEPDGYERYWAIPEERGLIDMTGVPIPGRDHWFFTPPPFCYVVKNKGCMYTLGVTTKPGAHTFTEFEYSGGRGQLLLLRYEGYTKVDGAYALPDVQIYFGTDEYELIHRFSQIEMPILQSIKSVPGWWKRPIFCGWGAQCSLSKELKVKPPALSCQDKYEQLAKALDDKGLYPGTLVIDDKWQQQYGLNNVDLEKWPDMKGFISSMHQKGKRVLLWLKAWDPEGLPAEWCIRDKAGAIQSADPTNPEYCAAFFDTCKALLSSQGLNADGFKIDFTARIPTCPGCTLYDASVWGMELMRSYLSMVHDSAKRVKEDALIMCHSPNAYLSDLIDMIRLNDINTGHPVCSQMQHRARLARVAMPAHCLIDTDNWPMPDKKSWLDYIRIQPSLGVPSLYYLWRMDNSDEEITPDELSEIRAVWQEADGH